MEATQDMLKINLGSKRKVASIDEETEVKRKIPRSSDQTSDDDTEFDLNARDGFAERDLSSAENKTQNGNQLYALNLREITNESIEFECIAKKTEDNDHLAENDVRGNDKESQESGIHYSRIPIESKTESNKDESSKQLTEDEEQIEKEEDTTATSREGQASLKVEDQKLETINVADENSIEEREDETRALTVENAEKEKEEEEFGINPLDSNETSDGDSEISPLNSDDEVSVEKEPNEYIYRILRFNESYNNGLRPKNIYSRISIQQHVESGSWGQESRYISCCKTIYGIERLGRLTNEYQRVREVVRINITKLKDRAQIIDLTKEEIRDRHISRGSNAWDYASKFEEVIIDPTSHVPSECVEKYGIVHMRSFKKT